MWFKWPMSFHLANTCSSTETININMVYVVFQSGVLNLIESVSEDFLTTLLTLMLSERPKLHTILPILSAIGLN